MEHIAGLVNVNYVIGHSINSGSLIWHIDLVCLPC